MAKTEQQIIDAAAIVQKDPNYARTNNDLFTTLLRHGRIGEDSYLRAVGQEMFDRHKRSMVTTYNSKLAEQRSEIETRVHNADAAQVIDYLNALPGEVARDYNGMIENHEVSVIDELLQEGKWGDDAAQQLEIVIALASFYDRSAERLNAQPYANLQDEKAFGSWHQQAATHSEMDRSYDNQVYEIAALHTLLLHKPQTFNDCIDRLNQQFGEAAAEKILGNSSRLINNYIIMSNQFENENLTYGAYKNGDITDNNRIRRDIHNASAEQIVNLVTDQADPKNTFLRECLNKKMPRPVMNNISHHHANYNRWLDASSIIMQAIDASEKDLPPAEWQIDVNKGRAGAMQI